MWNINNDESKKNRDFLVKEKSKILSETRTEIDYLFDLINSDEKNVKKLVSILNKNLINK